MFTKLRNQRPIPANALQITGEPTMREDLPEIVTMVTDRFDQIQLNTTGIKLGFDRKLMERLRYSGVNTLYMSFHGTTRGRIRKPLGDPAHA